MLHILFYTHSTFVLVTNIYNKYIMHICNKDLWCRYVSLYNENTV